MVFRMQFSQQFSVGVAEGDGDSVMLLDCEVVTETLMLNVGVPLTAADVLVDSVGEG